MARFFGFGIASKSSKDSVRPKEPSHLPFLGTVRTQASRFFLRRETINEISLRCSQRSFQCPP